MLLEQFSLEQATVEVRFSPAYVLWDRAGILWTEAAQKWPGLKVNEATPSMTSFSLGRHWEFHANVEQARVTALQPHRSLDEFLETVPAFVSLVARVLDVTHFTRLGFRQVFFREFSSAQEAAAAVIATNLVKVPGGLPFGISGTTLQPQWVWRWEGETLGIRLDLRAEGRSIDFNPPPQVAKLQPLHTESFGVLFDVDFYSVTPISLEELSLVEWIRGAIQVIRRDSDRIIGQTT